MRHRWIVDAGVVQVQCRSNHNQTSLSYCNRRPASIAVPVRLAGTHGRERAGMAEPRAGLGGPTFLRPHLLFDIPRPRTCIHAFLVRGAFAGAHLSNPSGCRGVRACVSRRHPRRSCPNLPLCRNPRSRPGASIDPSEADILAVRFHNETRRPPLPVQSYRQGTEIAGRALMRTKPEKRHSVRKSEVLFGSGTDFANRPVADVGCFTRMVRS